MRILSIPIVLELPPMWGDWEKISADGVYAFLAAPFRQLFPERPSNKDFLPMLTYYFFSVGLPEELIKALPIFGLSWLSQKINPAWRNKVGVTKPLDGIILGAVFGLGFALSESVHYVLDYSATYGKLAGLQLLIARIVPMTGHIAFSGYFGYYIGLSNLKPKRRWQCLLTGYLISAGTHALSNTCAMNACGGNLLSYLLVNFLIYSLLLGAIFKARQLSPTRSSL